MKIAIVLGTRPEAIKLAPVFLEFKNNPDVMSLMSWHRVDLLKMDIEGADATVLDASADRWLGRSDRS